MSISRQVKTYYELLWTSQHVWQADKQRHIVYLSKPQTYKLPKLNPYMTLYLYVSIFIDYLQFISPIC